MPHGFFLFLASSVKTDSEILVPILASESQIVHVSSSLRLFPFLLSNLEMVPV